MHDGFVAKALYQFAAFSSVKTVSEPRRRSDGKLQESAVGRIGTYSFDPYPLSAVGLSRALIPGGNDLNPIPGVT